MSNDNNNTSQLPRAQRKRNGMPVDNNPYDFTQEQDTTPSFNLNPDDYTFTEEGLKRGISIGEAKRLSGDNPTTPRQSKNGKFDGNTYDELETFIKGKLEHYKSLEESEEDRKKREKRERRDIFLTGIGDALSTFGKAYSYAAGVPSMETFSASDKMRERFEKAKAEREANSDRIYNYTLALDKLNNSKASADYQKEMLAIRKQQQDRLDRHEETQRAIADARVKYYEAQSNKNDEQAAYWKTKADLLERGWPQEQAEQAARIEERKARAAKYTHDANTPYKSGGSSSSGRRSTSSSAGTEKVTEKTDPRGRVTTTRTYTQPRQRPATQKQNTPTTTQKKTRATRNKGKFSSFSIH